MPTPCPCVGNCAPGSFTIPPAPISDLTSTIAKVDALTADGGTPTGPALQGAAAELTATGTSTATLVLVSDGESNCGTSPCEVAQDLVGSGFEVTIHTVGFRVSDSGRSELECVAGASGGTYVDVDNSDQLNDTLRELTCAKLQITTFGFRSPLAGEGTRTNVEVANLSPVTASNVQVLLEFENEADAPKGLNTFLRLGNILPGTTAQRTWIVGAPETAGTPQLNQPVASTMPFTIASWAQNADRVSTSGEIGGPMGDSGSSTLRSYTDDWLLKQVDAGHPIVIMGDSFSSGEGAFEYVTAQDRVAESCHRSQKRIWPRSFKREK